MKSEQNTSKKKVKDKELKVEKTSFKLTKWQKQQLTEIRDTYGKSYGVIVCAVIERIHQAMLDDKDAKLLNDAKGLDTLSEECFEVIKRSNPEAHKLLEVIVNSLYEMTLAVRKKNEILTSTMVKLREVIELLTSDKRLTVGELNHAYNQVVDEYLLDSKKNVPDYRAK